jgi:hypothetical protein
LYPNTIKLTTQQQPKEREKREREREREKKTNKKTPKENQAKELQQQHNICVVLCFWVFFAWYRVAVDKE